MNYLHNSIWSSHCANSRNLFEGALTGDHEYFRLCERILEVCHCPKSGSDDDAGMSYDVSAGNFTKQFVAFRFDDRGNRLVTLDSAKNGGHGAAAAAAASRINGESATRYFKTNLILRMDARLREPS